MATHKITLNQSSWNDGTAEIYFDDVSQIFYDDSDLTNEVVAITVPRRDGWQFNGFYSSSNISNPGTQYITPEGGFTDDFLSYCISHLTGSAKLSIYVNGTQKALKLTLNANGGIVGSGTVFLWYALDGSGWYDNDQCQGDVVHSVSRPRYDARLFRGYYNGTSTPGAQYIDMDGNFLPALESLALTGGKTIYASWASPVKITVSPNSGSGGTSSFYRDQLRGAWYADTTFSSTIESIVPHVRACFELLGLKETNSDTGVQVVSPDGVIDPTWAPTSNTTIYARWRRVSWECTISNASGVGGTPAIYYKVGTSSPNQFYFDDLCQGDEVSSVEVPTRDGYSLRGIYSASSGGTEYITRSGAITSALASLSIAAEKTFTAQWIAVYKVTLDDRGGAGGSGAVYYDVLGAAYYHDASLKTPAASVDVPGRECYAFAGYWSAATGGTLYINAGGSFTSDFVSLAPTASKTVYAHWDRVSYKVTLNDNGGAGGVGHLFTPVDGHLMYADDNCTEPVASVEMPKRVGYDATGYYATAAGGSKYVDAYGRILVSTAIGSDITIHARWKVRTYTLRFDYAGGSGPVEAKEVTYGQRIGDLPSASPPVSEAWPFDRWTIGLIHATADMVWDIDHDATAVAVWRTGFNDPVDYYGMAGTLLVCVKSSDGANHDVVETGHGGRLDIRPGDSSIGAHRVHGRILNPSNTYRVVGRGSVTLVLGRAYGMAKVGTQVREDGEYHRNITESGYMLTGFRLVTSADGVPELVVTGTGNEGWVCTANPPNQTSATPRLTDAINLYAVTLELDPDHVAQDPFGALSGGGELVECTTAGVCEAHVLKEYGMPCASDICYGKIVVTGRMASYHGEDAPTAGANFVMIASPRSDEENDFTVYDARAERSL